MGKKTSSSSKIFTFFYSHKYLYKDLQIYIYNTCKYIECSTLLDLEGKQKLKPANAVKVRHILTEKHSKMMEAKSQLEAGIRFDKVLLFITIF
jgi:hypothetical protein